MDEHEYTPYEYFLVCTETAPEMNREVRQQGEKGWEPYMGLVVGSKYLYQWLIRRKQKEAIGFAQTVKTTEAVG